MPATSTIATRPTTKGIGPPAFCCSSVIPEAAIQGFDMAMYHTAPNAKAATAAAITFRNSIAGPSRRFRGV
jgi:hypothetical protein